MAYCMYLRKSRADVGKDGDDIDTLLQHEHVLGSLARRQELAVGAIYREVVSGESIAARPMMQQLLDEVSRGLWDGVLVMEIERLARGDTVDQGIVAQAFKFSNTRIITPQKIFEPQNEFDEEYFEFGLFMSRREYKSINRRMQRGRLLGAMEGRYTGSRAPYGYTRRPLHGKGFTLVPDPVCADVVRMIFELYVTGEAQADGTMRRLGPALIAKKLNSLGICAPHGGSWSENSLRDMLQNPVYAGCIRYNHRPRKKSMRDGAVSVSRPRNENYMLVKGLHEAVVPRELFDLAKTGFHTLPRLRTNQTIKNPLSGLILCAQCGHKLVRRSYAGRESQRDRLMCPNPSCPTVSTSLLLVEQALLFALVCWYDGYKINPGVCYASSQACVLQHSLEQLSIEETQLLFQRGQLHDLLERGLYDDDTYTQRKNSLDARLLKAAELRASLCEALANGQGHISKAPDTQPVPLADVYPSLCDAGEKNEFLKALLKKAVYQKEGRGAPGSFTLTLYPSLPCHDIHHPCADSSVPISVKSARV